MSVVLLLERIWESARYPRNIRRPSSFFTRDQQLKGRRYHSPQTCLRKQKRKDKTEGVKKITPTLELKSMQSGVVH